MAQWNLTSEGERFKEFYGQNIIQMPLILAEERVPLSIAGIMKRRLEVRFPEFGKEYRDTSRESSIAQVADAWWTNYCDSGDGALYHPDGKIKVVTDASFLRELKPNTKLVDGAVLIAESDEEAREKYNQIDAPEFTREQIQKDRFGLYGLHLLVRIKHF